MSYAKLLTDKCDIYHLKSKDVNDGNFGIPSKDIQKEHYYSNEPDHVGVSSYFVEDNQTVIQAEPNQVITEVYKVHLLKNTDIRLNDKVVWNGLAYTTRKPRLIKNHHIEVTVFRSENI